VENLYKTEFINKEKKIIENLVIESSLKEDRINLQNLKSLRNSLTIPQKVIFDILSEHLIYSERISPYSSKFFFKNLRNVNIENYKSRLIKKNDIDHIIKISDTRLKNLILESIKLSSLHSKLTLDNSNSNTSYIEVTNGFFFEGLISSFSIKENLFFDAKVVLIDGFVESVSEIHHFLELSAKTEEYYIVFARGFSDEVIHTLKINFDRKTLKIIPIVVKFDLEGINLLNDIAVCCNSDVVNTQKGNLISSITIEELKRIEKINLSKEGLLINNRSIFIDSHIKNLQQKIIESNNDITEESIRKRIQRLGQNQISIKLPNSVEKSKDYYQLDNGIRSLKSAINYGIAEFENEIYPLASVHSGIFYSKKYLSILEDLGGIIC
jgi:hypothetical protein